ncbi:hypothetical protein KIW84_023498 [Lathyrus oleraceus]|uniref:MYB transcription factor n=1 Tax=Pisum sativum TaxID=3888 RepID=A0A9D5B6J4_PEA|nr:hypothetical protein KIW84_023498 [Pisum sativum]
MVYSDLGSLSLTSNKESYGCKSFVMDDDMEGKGSYCSEETNPNENNGSGKEEDNGQSSKCARGHWRPAEDSKLKELVALYGPQNWNLIAEKLEGRSGCMIIDVCVDSYIVVGKVLNIGYGRVV